MGTNCAYFTREMVTGDFQRRPNTSRIALVNGKLFGDRACFDIVEDDLDMRWCVAVRSKTLTGIWSRGPEGGPLLGGLGAGVRLFKITGRKVAE